MLALRISINFTLGIMAGAMRLRQVLNFGVRRPGAAFLQNHPHNSFKNDPNGHRPLAVRCNKAVAGHRTPRRSLTPSERLFMIASHACQISFYNY